MLKAFEVTKERRLKIYWSDDQGESAGEYDQIPASTILQFPTSFGSDIIRALVLHGWIIRPGPQGAVWHRGEDNPEPDPVVGTTTRSAVALKILCALLTVPHQPRALVIDDAFELADRFLARVPR